MKLRTLQTQTKNYFVIKYNKNKIVHPKLFDSYRKAKRELLVFLDMMPEYAESLTICKLETQLNRLHFGGKNYCNTEFLKN